MSVFGSDDMAETVGLKLDEKIKNRLKSLGEARERSPHWLMRDAIVKYLEREEIYEQEKREDQERWERYALTGEAIAHKDVTAWLDQVAKGKDSRNKPRR
jgi:predicted transcriptional regulator